mmetsp:Transcript_38218/g.82325  ORF Transcript_38218/g.82325 Transcript_38218/m.82325 type:complete len:82 (+) Transcript_38218:188-433(+)
MRSVLSAFLSLFEKTAGHPDQKLHLDAAQDASGGKCCDNSKVFETSPFPSGASVGGGSAMRLPRSSNVQDRPGAYHGGASP